MGGYLRGASAARGAHERALRHSRGRGRGTRECVGLQGTSKERHFGLWPGELNGMLLPQPAQRG